MAGFSSPQAAHVNWFPRTLNVGQMKMTGAAQQVSTGLALVNGITFKAKTGNTGSIWIGLSSVAVTDDGTGNGFRIAAGESSPLIQISDASILYVIGASANDVLYYIGN